MQIVWLGHSSFELRLDSETIVIDPWLENPNYPAGYDLTRCDTILLSHGHGDHIGSAVPLAQRFGSTVVANHEISLWLFSKGLEKVIGMGKGGTVSVGSIQATLTHAVHSSTVEDGDQLLPGGEAGGFVVHLPDGRRIFFAGDTAVHSDMALIRELYSPELAFLPIGGHYTMDPREAALAVKLLGVSKVIPMHFGTFPILAGTPAELRSLTSAEVVDLKAGQPWTY
jgi:L-ascorbate metabolism protein UlaG (beta-lactamase superfamily)